MKKLFAVIFTLVLFAFYSCDSITLSGINIEKSFPIEGSYTELQVENAFEVTVSHEATQITVTTDENVMPYVLVEKVGEKLRIHLKPLTLNVGMDLKVELPYNPALKNVKLSGASEFHSEYGLEGRKIEVELSGASEFHCDMEATEEIDMDLSGASQIKSHITANELDLELSGASDATLEGQVTKLDIDLSGASNITKKVIGNRYALICDRCEGQLSGASDAFIHCDGIIQVSLSGASDLHYTGDAATSGSSTSGSSGLIHDVL